MRPKTTGNFETREALERAVHIMHLQKLSWRAMAEVAGVTDPTIIRILKSRRPRGVMEYAPKKVGRPRKSA